MTIRTFTALSIGLLVTAPSFAESAVVLARGETIEIADTLADPTDLWVGHEDLARISGFEIKPEGACLGPICIPLRKDDDSLAVTRDGKQWINATELARIVKQPVVAEPASRVWSFGEVPGNPSGYLESAKAPDFELKDRTGKVVKLSDFHGKKVLLMTWASW